MSLSMKRPRPEPHCYWIVYPPSREYIVHSLKKHSCEERHEHDLINRGATACTCALLSPVPVEYKFFEDGNPNFRIEKLHQFTNTHVIYICDWSTPEARYYDMCNLIPIAELGPATLKIVLPFISTATMERESVPGSIASANIDAKLLSALPGRKQLVTIDLHTLQNQFYFHSSTVTLASFMPLVRDRLLMENTDTAPGCVESGLSAEEYRLRYYRPNKNIVVAFPDDGAAKRFKRYFADEYSLAVCSKQRGDNDERFVTLAEGDVRGREVLIIDDLVRSGGTLIECAKVLQEAGASAVDVFVTHAVFPHNEWRRFIVDESHDHRDVGDGHKYVRHFYTTDTVPKHVSAMRDDQEKKFTVFSCSDLLVRVLEGRE